MSRKDKRKHISPYRIHSKAIKEAPKEEKLDDGSIKFYLEGFGSTVAKDGSGDIVRPEGIRLDRYLHNPVVKRGHKRGEENNIGYSTSVEIIEDKGLYIKTEIILNPEIPAHKELIHGIRHRLINGFSIGFGDIEMFYDKDKDANIIESMELFEISLVDIPDNPLTITKMLDIYKKNLEEEEKVFNPDETEEKKEKEQEELSSDKKDAGIEEEDMDKEDEMEEKVESLEIGQFVEWNSSGGMAIGKVEDTKSEAGEGFTPTGSEQMITADENDPVALIRLFDMTDDGAVETDQMVVHKFSALTVISAPEMKQEEEQEEETKETDIVDELVEAEEAQDMNEDKQLNKGDMIKFSMEDDVEREGEVLMAQDGRVVLMEKTPDEGTLRDLTIAEIKIIEQEEIEQEEEEKSVEDQYEERIETMEEKEFEQERDEVFAKYSDTVNMSASELKAWSETECSKLASLDRSPIERNLRLLEKNKEEWTRKDVSDANRTISFVSRMKNAEQGDDVTDENGKNCGSKRDISLKNWAYNPNKASNADSENRQEVEKDSWKTITSDGTEAKDVAIKKSLEIEWKEKFISQEQVKAMLMESEKSLKGENSELKSLMKQQAELLEKTISEMSEEKQKFMKDMEDMKKEMEQAKERFKSISMRSTIPYVQEEDDKSDIKNSYAYAAASRNV